ncbi:SOS response-associated peptidase [Luteococcus peritonei]|uniref:Abasic site processing protein n=1 Tax=Luteococcus peritonei TaxID=88874 RepID=A0ABW4RYC1_9ACTN
MCGRYAASASQAQLVEVFEVDEVVELPGQEPLAPRYNIAPTDPVPAVMERTDKATGQVARKLARPRWGLVPSWSKDPAGAARMINARSETVAEKPAFRKAFATRRCLLPADGYYEWYTLQQPAPASGGRAPKPVKQPFWIHPLPRPDEPELMVMAGLYEFWRNPALAPEDPDAWLTTCTVITTQATDELGHIHDRMPMQVRRRDWDHWLDPGLTDPLAAHDLLHVPGPQEMTAWAVSRLVSNVRNDGPELVQPVPTDPTQGEPEQETLL